MIGRLTSHAIDVDDHQDQQHKQRQIPTACVMDPASTKRTKKRQ